MGFNFGNQTGLKLWDRIKLQTFKAIVNKGEAKSYERKFKNWRRIGNQYSLVGDKDLTRAQIQEIDDFWERYKFAYPEISYNEFKVYMNRTGRFDPRYIPNGIRTIFIAPYFQHKHYYWSEQNKTLLDKIFHNVKQPHVIVRRMNGYFYDGEYNRIDLTTAVNLCLGYLNKGKEVIFKPNDISGGGVGIEFIKNATVEELTNSFQTKARSFVIQNVMKQHEQMGRLNPHAVNTLRITSIIWQNEVVVLAAAVRIGTSQKRVDNWNAGGMIVGLDLENGSLYPFGLNKKGNAIYETIGGVNLKEGYQIPYWDEVLRTVTKAHNNIPYIKLASWDIAIDEEGTPTLIEVNFAGDWHVHQLTTGPILGELTQEILDKSVLDKYNKKHVSLNFDFQEFHDHVAIKRYVGCSKKVVIPQMKCGKPVTVIERGAFSSNKYIEEVVLPSTVEEIGVKVFSGCVSLKKINLLNGVKVHETAFDGSQLMNKQEVIK